MCTLHLTQERIQKQRSIRNTCAVTLYKTLNTFCDFRWSKGWESSQKEPVSVVSTKVIIIQIEFAKTSHAWNANTEKTESCLGQFLISCFSFSFWDNTIKQFQRQRVLFDKINLIIKWNFKNLLRGMGKPCFNSVLLSTDFHPWIEAIMNDYLMQSTGLEEDEKITFSPYPHKLAIY